jgi:hypothetical protein
VHLVFAGCSFVEGEALCWQEFYEEEPPLIIARDPRHAEYCARRQPYTLAARTAALMDSSYTDISHDGMSNLAIAHRTIEWLEANGHKDTCVCVGWTEPIRRMVWDGFWINMSIHAFNDPRLPKEFRSFVEQAIVARPNQDHWLDYLTSVYLLNNYFRARGIRSVQWRSMGEPFDPLPGLADPTALVDGHWLTDPNGPSWHNLMTDAQRISPGNLHPNQREVAAHAERIYRNIKA